MWMQLYSIVLKDFTDEGVNILLKEFTVRLRKF